MHNAPIPLRYSLLASAPLALALGFAVSPSRANAPAPPASDPYTMVVTYDSCVRECDDERGVRATDRHTCQLTCDAVLETQLDGASSEVIALTTSTIAWRSECVTECRQDPALTRTDRETCLLTCSESAAAMCTGAQPRL